MSGSSSERQAAGPLSPQEDVAFPVKTCNLIMKGGITSGVIYPLAVCELAKHFRFKGIGGTSAGAIAAAASAAAELGRSKQTNGMPTQSFDRLAELPAWLAANLTSLFQPQRSTRPLFLLVRAASTRSILRTLFQAINGRRLAFALSIIPWLALMLLVLNANGWRLSSSAGLAVVLGAVGGVLTSLGVLSYSYGRILTIEVPKNYFGLCTGYADAEEGRPAPLTNWLTDLLNELSGTGDRPLTFGDLWGAEAIASYPQEGFEEKAWDEHIADRQIDLRMMTTDLSLGRAYQLPTENSSLTFCRAEMSALFPRQVVDHLLAHSSFARRYSSDAVEGHVSCPTHPDESLHYLPRSPDLPVIIATRMSLSFPLLISALPLYTVDYAQTDHPVVKSWFSDGGITSNIPIHFFQELIPTEPTFAINLRPRPPDHPSEDVYYPTSPRSSRTDWKPIVTIGTFLISILKTMQNWADNAQLASPELYGRICHVHLGTGEGGLNLDMSPSTVLALANRGQSAASMIAENFDPALDVLIRYRNALSVLGSTVNSFTKHWDRRGEEATQWIEQLREVADHLESRPGFGAPRFEYRRIPIF